ncbi:carboxymuconolactone decarboxylase family protein [Micromonospora terminaliae]|uniref:Carboxymuconolactone decarboxylase family protein n=1 Tax=Micromonospora terminaliae TaxID=1914461 RepID=A0AAJ2ZJL9_9ACTN|nr:carboxymuconolactone decarboxylase family protein [Micromonospora terminaliae]QGL51272.1 carboxymuconolactone decarboxylase family protein [Micromonospora terminaliae]
MGTVYRRIEAEFGMLAPPLALHSPAPAVLAASWSILREVMVVPGLVPRAEKEAVAAAVSLANNCPYCAEVHGTTLRGLVRGKDPEAIAAGRIEKVTDQRLRALAGWAVASADAPGPAPFAPAQAPELIGTVLTFHYINRMVNVFLQESPLPPVQGLARDMVRRGAARVMRRLASATPLPGLDTDDLLPAAPVPGDLSWAAGRPAVANALARAAGAIDEGGERRLTEEARGLVRAALREPGPHAGSAPWLQERLDTLPARDRPATRLALLAAVASFRVTDAVIAGVRTTGADDAALIEITSWASMTAARHIAAGQELGDHPGGHRAV